MGPSETFKITRSVVGESEVARITYTEGRPLTVVGAPGLDGICEFLTDAGVEAEHIENIRYAEQLLLPEIDKYLYTGGVFDRSGELLTTWAEFAQIVHPQSKLGISLNAIAQLPLWTGLSVGQLQNIGREPNNRRDTSIADHFGGKSNSSISPVFIQPGVLSRLTMTNYGVLDGRAPILFGVLELPVAETSDIMQNLNINAAVEQIIEILTKRLVRVTSAAALQEPTARADSHFLGLIENRTLVRQLLVDIIIQLNTPNQT